MLIFFSIVVIAAICIIGAIFINNTRQSDMDRLWEQQAEFQWLLSKLTPDVPYEAEGADLQCKFSEEVINRAKTIRRMSRTNKPKKVEGINH